MVLAARVAQRNLTEELLFVSAFEVCFSSENDNENDRVPANIV